MSIARNRRQPPAEEPADAGGLIQDLLVQIRQLKVDNERLRLDAREVKERAGRPDPRVRWLEAENQRLREELRAARDERDALREGLEGVMSQLERGSRRRH